MIKYGKAGLSVVAMACCATMIGQSVSAFNPYGITYTGGEPLGSNNVNINPDLATFTNLVTVNGIKDVETFGDGWEKGYLELSGRCAEFSYVKVWDNYQYNTSSNLSWIVRGDKYEVRNSIRNVIMDGVTQFTEDSATTIGVRKDDGFLMVGFGDEYVYEDNKCTQQVPGLQNFIETAPMSEGKAIYVETMTHLFKSRTTESLNSGDVYYVISDIDTSQSYKIMNPGLQLGVDNMYAVSVEDLQYNVYDGSERNMFNPDTHSIYSEYNEGSSMGSNDANIFVKMRAEDLIDGVDIVYGFARYAGSSVGEFYAKQYIVDYISDNNGTIAGINNENVISNGNPSGSSSKANDGYKFVYWTANKKVKLSDGTVIEAGKEMTPAQVKQVVVNENITFKAIHEEAPITITYKVIYTSDDNGEITGIKNENVESGNNPNGSASDPKEGYEFKYWVANVDVTLSDGAVIKAGEKLTAKQVKQVVVNEDITFKAIHEKLPEKPADNIPVTTPDTGVSTMELGVEQIKVSILWLFLAAVAVTTTVAATSRLTHKKVGFKKK